MKKIALIAAAFVLCVSAAAFDEYVPASEGVKAREQFNRERFGIFVHWGIYSMLADGEWAMNQQSINYLEYARLAGGFYPSKFDAKEWAALFKEAGAKYVTFTSRHHDGFSMFKTAQSEYNIVDATPFKRDVCKELADALHEEGINLHFYYSQLDWHRTDYWPQGSKCGHDLGRPEGKEGDWDKYLAFMRAQLTELLTQYGPVGAIWYDGYWDKKKDYTWEELYDVWDLKRQYELIHTLQPSCLVVANHHTKPYPGEDVQAFERDVPGENKGGHSAGVQVSKLPLETCQTMNKDWGYKICNSPYKSLKELIVLLSRTASKGANLLLNVGPRPDGTIPDQSVCLLRQIGAWLKVNGESIYCTEAGCIAETPWGVSTQNGCNLYLHILDADALEGAITLPYSLGKLKEVSFLADGTPIKFTRNKKDGIVFTVPEFDKTNPDCVIKLTFASEIQ